MNSAVRPDGYVASINIEHGLRRIGWLEELPEAFAICDNFYPL